MSFLNLIPGFANRGAEVAEAKPTSTFLSNVHFPAPTHVNGRTGWHIKGEAYLDLNQFKLELALLSVAVVYGLWFLIVRSHNRTRAYAWVRAALPELEQEFSNIATETPYGKSPLVWNGASEAVFFATGRRAIDSLHAFFQFTPLHDPIYMITSSALDSFIPGGSAGTYERNFLSLAFNLSHTADNISGVFAIIDKSALRQTKTAARFDLTFGKLIEASNAASQRKLDEKWAILTESNDLTDMYLGEINEKGAQQRERVGIQKLLDPNHPCSKWLESLVITDQPLTRPTAGPIPVKDKPRRILLTMRIPRTAAQAKETLLLLGLALDIADALSGSIASSPLKLRSDTHAKLRKIRQEVDKALEEESMKDKREAEKEKLAEAKAKAEKEKWNSLSPAEQERKKEVERKRQMKKGVKQVKR